MPRKSLSEERTAQILDAMERCVAQLGLAGTSLEQVAQEAGVKRSILRHYVGNRDELILAMAHRLTDRYREQLRQLSDYVGDVRRVDRLVDALFVPTSDQSSQDVVLVEALIAASEDDDEIRSLMTALTEETIEAVRGVLRFEYPDSSARTLWEVAYGVVGVYFNYESLHPLTLPRRHRSAAMACVRRLISTLH